MKNCKVKYVKNAIIIFQDKKIENVFFNPDTKNLVLYLENEESKSEIITIDLSEMKLNKFQTSVFSNFIQ